mgnify:CR=1 FL=1
MKNIKKYIDLLHNDKICQYLKLKGWHEISSLFEGKVKQFLAPNQEYAILIPMTKEFSDYYRVMQDALLTIATFDNKTLNGLLTILINPSSDILKWRIADDNTLLGTISFNTMRDNIDNIKNILASTCIDIINPSQYHKKIMLNDVQNQIASYKFGQTEIGSYILNLVSPLGFYQYQLFDPNIEELPINRRINMQMLENINNIQQSVLENNNLLDENVASGKISVNFLNALTRFYENNKDSDVSISATWDINIPTIKDNPINNLTLYPKCIEKVVQIAEKYTPTQEQNVLKTYYGKITNINGAPEIDSRDKLVITLASIGDENQRITIKVELDNSIYSHIVTEAFEKGANVKVTGTNQITAKTIKLLNAEIIKLD